MSVFWKVFYIGVIIIEFITIGFYGYILYRKKVFEKNVLGTAIHIDPLKKENLVVSSEGQLAYFFESKPNILDKEYQKSWLPGQIVYTINTDSLNERYDYAIEKPANAYRILTLGDSYTFGHFVNTSDNWTEVLEDLLNTQVRCKNSTTFEVINLGERGYDMDYSIHRYMKRGQKYRPDLIVWLLVENDFFNINEEFFGKLHEIEKNATKEELHEMEASGDTYRFWRQAQEDMKKRLTDKQIFDHQNSVASRFLQQIDMPIVLLTFPNLSNPHKKQMSLWPFFNKNISIRIQHQLPDIEKENGTYKPNDFHPNATGHKLIAESVFDYFLKNDIIPCETSRSGNLQ